MLCSHMERLGTAYLQGGINADYAYIEGPQPDGFLIYTRCAHLNVSLYSFSSPLFFHPNVHI